MSRLLEHLTALETNERRILNKPLNMVSGKLTTDNFGPGGDYGTVYTVTAKLGTQVVVTPEMKLASKTDFYSELKARVYLPLAEEIFGEYRQPLLDADLALMQGNPEEASRLIHSVLGSMFRV